MLTIFLQILPLFLIIGLGWVIAKINIAQESWLKPIGDFTVYIGFPALIFFKLLEAPLELKTLGKSFVLNSGLLLSTTIALTIFLRFTKFTNQIKGTLILCFMFGNLAFLGIPAISSINPNWSQAATVNAAIHLFWIFSAGIFLVEFYTQEEPRISKILGRLIKNPLLLAVLAGICVNLLKIEIPEVVFKPIKMLGGAVSPLVMLMIGIFIQTHPTKELKELRSSFVYSILKLVIFPIIGLLAAQWFDIIHYSPSAVLSFAMPLAISPFALANMYNLHQRFIASAIIMSTILSVLTLPLIASLL